MFNLSAGNLRISELALRTQRALADMGIKIELEVDYSYRLLRSYRVSTEKVKKILDFEPAMSVDESIHRMVEGIERFGYSNFSHPRYYNIEWMKLLEEAVDVVHRHGYVLSKPSWRGDRGASGDRVARLPSDRIKPAG